MVPFAEKELTEYMMQEPQAEDTEKLAWGDVTYQPTQRGTLEQQHTAYQRVLHKHALARLDTELKSFVQNMPRRELPTYQSGNGVTVPPPPMVASPILIEKDPGMADRVYSRSAVQRYVLQKLATELHGSLEERRDEIPFETFRDVLQAPNSVEFSKLNPNVTMRAYDAHSDHNTTPPIGSSHQTLNNASFTTPSLFGRSHGSFLGNSIIGNHNASMMMMPPSMQQQQQQGGGSTTSASLTADAPPQHQPRVVVDSASFLNMHRGVRVRNYKPPPS